MSLAGTSIAGRKHNDGVDYYQTPSWAVEKLLEKEKFTGNILEPCAGAGAISKVLEAHGYEVISADIREDESVYGTTGANFLEKPAIAPVGNVITNPPYCCACEFVKRSLEVASGKVAMLLKLTFLESVRRYEFFKNSPLRTVYVFSSRVSMYPGNQEKQPRNGGTIAFAWFVWEPGYSGAPAIDWLI